MLAILLALGASVCWGTGDFFGGLTTRRASLWAVVAGSQGVGLAGAALAVLLVGRPWPGLDGVWPVLLGGAAGAVAIPTFYKALAIGTMSIVAPISATSVLIPFVAGLAAGERPSVAQLVGTAVVATGVVLVASEPARRGEAVGAPALPGGPAVEPEVAAQAVAKAGSASTEQVGAGARGGGARAEASGRSGTPAQRRRTERQAIGLSLLAAACIGLTLLGYDAAAQHDPVWAMLAGRASSATFIGLFLVATRPRIVATAAAVPGIVTVGLADTGANGLFALATTQGYLSIVAVLGSVYPAVTVLLAFAFLHERIAPHQLAGVAATLVGVSLIAAG